MALVSVGQQQGPNEVLTEREMGQRVHEVPEDEGTKQSVCQPDQQLHSAPVDASQLELEHGVECIPNMSREQARRDLTDACTTKLHTRVLLSILAKSWSSRSTPARFNDADTHIWE